MARNFFSGNIYGKTGQSAGGRATRKMFDQDEERKKKKKQTVSKKAQPQQNQGNQDMRATIRSRIAERGGSPPLTHTLGDRGTQKKAVSATGYEDRYSRQAQPTSGLRIEKGEGKIAVPQEGGGWSLERPSLITNRSRRERKGDKFDARAGGRKAYGPQASKALAQTGGFPEGAAKLAKGAAKAKRAKTELEAARQGIQTEASDWGWSPGDKRPGPSRQQRISKLQSQRQEIAQEGFGDTMEETMSRLGRYKDLGQQIEGMRGTGRDIAVQKLRNKAGLQQQRMQGEQRMQEAAMQARGDVWSSIVEGRQDQGIDTQTKFQAAQEIDKNLRGQMVPHPEKEGELISYDELTREQKQKKIRDELSAITGGAGILGQGGQDTSDRLGIDSLLQRAKQG